MEGLLKNVDDLRKRLTPGHIGLFTYVPKNKPVTEWSKTKTNFTKDKGTYCVAKQSIGRGDILIREQPFIRQIHEDCQNNHCGWCFRHIDMGIADDIYFCRNEDCLWFGQFCSNKCEEENWKSGHGIICRFAEMEWLDRDILFAIKGYIRSLSYRYDKIPGLVSNIEMETTCRIKELKEKFKMVGDLFYLTDNDIEKLVDIYFQIKCNGFTVKAIEQLDDKDYGYIVSRNYTTLGKAVYLQTSKVNHSCNPNSLVSFGEEDSLCEIKIQSIKDLKEGEELTISYGPLATKLNKQERRKILKDNYYFDCQCSACDENNENSPDKIYKCQFCKTGKLYRQQTTCTECDQQPYWPYFLKTEGQIEEFKIQNNYLKVVLLQEKIYHSNTLPIGDSYDKLAQIFCQQGQWKLAADYSKKSLKIAETIYGKLSIEVAEEMMKLSSILFNAQQNPEAIRQIKATMILYQLLGLDKTAPEDMDELKAMQTHLIFMFR